jgi:hypothetical protein
VRYAINLADMLTFQRDNPMIHAILVQPRLTHEVVKAEGKDRMDGGAVLLMEDDAGKPDQAKSICEVLRLRNKKSELRIYQSRTGSGGWERI